MGMGEEVGEVRVDGFGAPKNNIFAKKNLLLPSAQKAGVAAHKQL